MPEAYTRAAPRARCRTTTPEAGRPPEACVATWKAASRCAGQTGLMYEHARRAEAKALCASCPVAAVCLWSTMAAEADEPHPYRYGTAGGLGPLQRQRLADRLSRAEVDARLAEALAIWPSEASGAASTPPPPRYRPWRKCRGCTAVIRQPRAGRPQLWCSSACQWRTSLPPLGPWVTRCGI